MAKKSAVPRGMPNQAGMNLGGRRPFKLHTKSALRRMDGPSNEEMCGMGQEEAMEGMGDEMKEGMDE